MDKQAISFVMGKRLKELREERGLSHDKLIKQLNERYGVSVSRDSVMAYEISDEKRSKANKLPNMGMRVEYLYCLADFYGVSIDYLLGKADVRTPNCTVQSMCKYTGLSEASIENLSEISKREKRSDSEVAPIYAVDRVIMDPSFKAMAEEMAALVGKGSFELYRDIDNPEDFTKVLLGLESMLKHEYHTDFYIMCGTEVRDRYIENATFLLKGILEDMYFELEAKKEKHLAERSLAEIMKMPTEFQERVVQAMIAYKNEDDDSFAKFDK